MMPEETPTSEKSLEELEKINKKENQLMRRGEFMKFYLSEAKKKKKKYYIDYYSIHYMKKVKQI